jgi:hypothetical protein
MSDEQGPGEGERMPEITDRRFNANQVDITCSVLSCSVCIGEGEYSARRNEEVEGCTMQPGQEDLISGLV